MSDSVHAKAAFKKDGTYNNNTGSLEPIVAESLLRWLHQQNIFVDGLVTDGHKEFKPMIDKLKSEGILPQSCKIHLDIWHYKKSILKKLPNLVSITKQELKKKVGSHLGFCLVNCDRDPTKLRLLFLNMVNHWKNLHEDCHATSPCKQEGWKSTLVFSDSDLEDPMSESIAKMLCHNQWTSHLEAFHRTILIYCPKALNFRWSYRLCIMLAILDCSEILKLVGLIVNVEKLANVIIRILKKNLNNRNN
jgi:hypothetical protein